MVAQDGKMRKLSCANTEGLFRIIQSIPSPKAEPFKLWLARVGYERVQEIEDPELAQKRMKEMFRQKGYSDAWIEKRECDTSRTYIKARKMFPVKYLGARNYLSINELI